MLASKRIVKIRVEYIYIYISFFSKDEVYEWTKTSDYDLCYRYIRKHIECFSEKLNQCELKLNKQIEASNIPESLLRDIDMSLRDFVQYQRKYLTDRNNRLLTIYKNQLNNEQSQHIQFEQIISQDHVNRHSSEFIFVSFTLSIRIDSFPQ